MTAAGMEPPAQRRAVPYVSLTALKKLLDRMAEHGPPGRVDRSYLPNMSGGYQAQLLAALRALGLIDGMGLPTPELHRLVSDLEAEWPGFLQRQVGLLYPEAVALAEGRGSAAQLQETFKHAYGLNGSTLEGAIRFFLDASALAGLPLSPHFKAPTRPRKTPARMSVSTPARAGRAARLASVPEPPTSTVGGMPATTQHLQLQSGGTLALTVAVDLFSLSEADRTFVFELVDKIKGYAPLASEPPKSTSQDTPVVPSSQDG